MRRLIDGLLLAAVLGVVSAPRAEGKNAAGPVRSVVDETFEILSPADWAIERKPGGVVLTGPSAEGLPARIVVRWVGSDHALYGTAADYMARLVKPSSIPMKGWENGPLETVAAVGRKALRLRRKTTEFVPPEGVSPKEVAIREEHLAVPAAGGFYLLVYSAPRALDASQRPVYRRLIRGGFKPKR
jgi:hypothetical protein